MKALKCLLTAALTVCAVSAAGANPIPPPSDTQMPLEDMYAELVPIKGGTGLEETFCGTYYFENIPENVRQIIYPLPPENEAFAVAMGKLPKDWNYSLSILPTLHEMLPEMKRLDWTVLRMLYPTILPEWPWIPVHGWSAPGNDPFPPKTVFSVKYRHDVLRRGRNYIYFYALGSGKANRMKATEEDDALQAVAPEYADGVTSYLDITMPRYMSVLWLKLGSKFYPYSVTTEGDKTVVSFHAKTKSGPFRDDLIAKIHPWYMLADANFDGRVNILDLIAVRNDLGTVPSDAKTDAADINGDGKVNVIDLIIVRNHLGQDIERAAKCHGQVRLRYRVKNPESQPPGIKPSIRAWGRRMVISDQIRFNCCAEYVRMTIRKRGNLVTFREKAIEEAPCDCVGYYPMRGIAGPFETGTYKVRLLDPYGKVRIEKEISIP